MRQGMIHEATVFGDVIHVFLDSILRHFPQLLCAFNVILTMNLAAMTTARFSAADSAAVIHFSAGNKGESRSSWVLRRKTERSSSYTLTRISRTATSAITATSAVRTTR